ncbi:Vacuolar protein sorting-associated protein 26B-A [Termitomyces sp. J132]|nr:Vacuolar protein sorting-associated protein 26B-A [Termitomyces sp. J132]
MELSITRRESTGALPNQYNESERLTPTFRDVNKKFNKRYYLNLVLIDKENPRYFKQQVRHLSPSPSTQQAPLQEITIFRILEVC